MSEATIKARGTVLVDGETKAIRETNEGTIVTFIASDLSEDRDQERINPRGWVVPRGTINVLVDHDYKIEKVVGKVVGYRTVGDQFHLDVLFADKVSANPMAKFAVAMLDGGFLGPVSVGFIGLEWTEPDGTKRSRAKGDSPFGVNPGRVYDKQELLELSLVAVGSNRNAMQAAFRAFAEARALGPEDTGTPVPARSESVSPPAEEAKGAESPASVQALAEKALPDPADDWLLAILKSEPGESVPGAHSSREVSDETNHAWDGVVADLRSAKRA